MQNHTNCEVQMGNIGEDMIELARQYGRYGYRRIAALLRDAGWQINDKRVERLWRREGLQVPQKQPKKGRLWLDDGSCIRLRAEYTNHVWSYDFVHHRTDDGRVFRTLNVLDEHSREYLAIRIKRKLNSIDVIDALTDLFILRGVPGYIRSDNGPEFIAVAVRDWIAAVGAKTAYIQPGSPWENGLNILRLVKAIVRSWNIPTFRAGLMLAVLIFLSGTIFYRTAEGWSWIDSLYFSTTTLTTVGLGDLAPRTDIGKLFTVVYIFVGVGVFVALMAQFARAMLRIEDKEIDTAANRKTKDQSED